MNKLKFCKENKKLYDILLGGKNNQFGNFIIIIIIKKNLNFSCWKRWEEEKVGLPFLIQISFTDKKNYHYNY